MHTLQDHVRLSCGTIHIMSCVQKVNTIGEVALDLVTI